MIEFFEILWDPIARNPGIFLLTIIFFSFLAYFAHLLLKTLERVYKEAKKKSD